MPRPTKKQKRDAPAPASTAPPTLRASFTSLPFEILAEVLLYTCSPPTVVAVSRTCSFLQRTLAENPAAAFIWRGVRKTCKPGPLPDLGDLWKKSEAELAALAFSGGVCEVCQRRTRAMYASFAVRARLCGSWHCRRKFINDVLIDASVMFTSDVPKFLWVPYVETNGCFRASGVSDRTWPHLHSNLLRKTDLEKFKKDLVIYEASERTKTADGAVSGSNDEETKRIVKRCNAAIQRFPGIMELSVRLNKWKATYDREYEKMKKQNQLWTQNLASGKGIDWEDLVASPSYGSLQSRKNFLLESIETNDVEHIWSVVETELLAMQARRQRQKAETGYMERLSQVKKMYEGMRSGTLKGIHGENSKSRESLVLPSLSVFCTLPSVRLLKGNPDPRTLPPNKADVSNNIKSSPLATSLILSDIQTWLIPVEKHLMRLLGYPNGWHSASTRILPPLKRMTARFFCRRCGEGNVGQGHQRQGCLDLKGVCAHVCVQKKKKALHEDGTETGNGQDKGESGDKNTSEWTVDMFEKEDKAIRIIKNILERKGLSEDDPASIACFNELGSTIQCMTCTGWIVMDYKTAIGHAHRHESMKVEIGKGGVNDRLPEFERGLTELLLGPSYRARNLCKKVDYVCKHCLDVEDLSVLILGWHSSSTRKNVRRMTFHGLRSHVKEKHGIQEIRDEDFYSYTGIQQLKDEKAQV